MITFLKGKKTYILGVAALIVIGLQIFGLVDVDSSNTLLALLGFGGLITLRAGIKK